MAYACSMRVAGIEFDIYNGERVSPTLTKWDYYVTPRLAMQIDKWRIQNSVDKISTKEQMEFLISQGFIKKYSE